MKRMTLLLVLAILMVQNIPSKQRGDLPERQKQDIEEFFIEYEGQSDSEEELRAKLQKLMPIVEQQPSFAPARLALGVVRMRIARVYALKKQETGSAQEIRELERRFERLKQSGMDEILKAITLDPTYAEAHYQLAHFLSLEKPYEAIEHYRLATGYDPNHDGAYLALAMLLQQHGDIDGAIEALNKHINVDNPRAEIRCEPFSLLANLLITKVRIEEALEVYERLFQRLDWKKYKYVVRDLADVEGENVTSYIHELARRALATHRYEDAVYSYQVLMRRDPRQAGDVIRELKDIPVKVVSDFVKDLESRTPTDSRSK